MLDVAAVVLTHGEHQSYRQVLSDLLAQGLAPDAICIVHNPVRASDRSVQAPLGVGVIRMSRNAGYAEGMNAGIEWHLDEGVRWIWLLTHDVRLYDDALNAMMRAADESLDFAALGPLLVQAGTETVFSLGGERTRWGHPYNAGHGTQLRAHREAVVAPRRCVWVDGSSIMLRAQAVREVGPYDTSLFGYTEDAELCLRLQRAGWLVGVVEAAIAEQSSGMLSRPGPVTFLLARNNLLYARKAAGRAAVLPILGGHVLQSARHVRRAITGPRRRLAVIQCFAVWIGVLAFFLRPTGPPPPWLPGQGDMA